eukprot:TRINITY_DN5991_c0_g1_i1.p1 TRINITY_DN5991_c0_g1~~TRINITY_DN5991_c0_g1_i1.p1  ORF type:complete len:242 (+),score=55.39 TRINITY_DN5991_c0_g1_i1:321-1046(+)
MNLYRETQPHAGFGILLDVMSQKPKPGFVFTSNVDGHFQKAGFAEDRIVECHGSLQFIQCIDPSRCSRGANDAVHSSSGLLSCFPIDPSRAPEPRGASDAVIASSADVKPVVDLATLHAESATIPRCPAGCDKIGRPNVLMFGDGSFAWARTDEQEVRYERWQAEMRAAGARLVVIELGAGKAVPTVRRASEVAANSFKDSTLIRINPREHGIPKGTYEGISVPMGSLAALQAIQDHLKSD